MITQTQVDVAMIRLDDRLAAARHCLVHAAIQSTSFTSHRPHVSTIATLKAAMHTGLVSSAICVRPA